MGPFRVPLDFRHSIDRLFSRVLNQYKDASDRFTTIWYRQIESGDSLLNVSDCADVVSVSDIGTATWNYEYYGSEVHTFYLQLGYIDTSLCINT